MSSTSANVALPFARDETSRRQPTTRAEADQGSPNPTLRSINEDSNINETNLPDGCCRESSRQFLMDCCSNIISVGLLIYVGLVIFVLVRWVGLIKSFIASSHSMCDVPLKLYFWLVTTMVILTVIQTMFLCFWENCLARVCNIAITIYSLYVLGAGIQKVIVRHDGIMCRDTAPRLYESSVKFVWSLILAWSMYVLILLISCIRDNTTLRWGITSPPNSCWKLFLVSWGFISNKNVIIDAPPHDIDLIRWEDLPHGDGGYPGTCSICLQDFCVDERVVATPCRHVFHTRCCSEWLRQVRSCPVCRADIPRSEAGAVLPTSTST